MQNNSLRKKYTAAIAMLLLSMILFYATNYYLIEKQGKYGENINLVGKERMLSAKMLYYINHLFHHVTQEHKDSVIKTIREFESIENTLIQRGYVFETQTKKEYLDDIRYFLDNIDSYKTQNEQKNILTDEIFEDKYEQLITKIDAYVLKVQRESESSINNLLRIQTVLFILFIILLVIEVIFIFLPAEKEIKQKTKELKEINNDLQKRIDIEVKKNEKQTLNLIQQSRLAQMGEMLSMIAHQWRQPLASISTISGTLLLDVMMDNYKAEFFEKKLSSIDELSNYLSSTINDFKKFFKENKELESMQAKELVNESLKIITPSIESKKIEIITKIEDGIELNTYVSELKQTLLNLLKNAEDVLVDKKVDDPIIRIDAIKKDDLLEISVEDNGGGINPDIIDKIFDPYFSTKKMKDGTGLGLYMSKTIVEDHCQGKLSVKNSEEGARFTISVPLDISRG